MNKSLELSIYEIIGSKSCVTSDDGQKIYNRLKTALEKEQNITLSFHNITTLTAISLNVAIGQLYGTFSEKEIRSLLKLKNIPSEDKMLLKRVVKTAKQYFEI